MWCPRRTAAQWTRSLAAPVVEERAAEAADAAACKAPGDDERSDGYEAAAQPAAGLGLRVLRACCVCVDVCVCVCCVCVCVCVCLSSWLRTIAAACACMHAASNQRCVAATSQPPRMRPHRQACDARDELEQHPRPAAHRGSLAQLQHHKRVAQRTLVRCMAGSNHTRQQPHTRAFAPHPTRTSSATKSGV
jgi:hypothetical protein